VEAHELLRAGPDQGARERGDKRRYERRSSSHSENR